MVQRADFVPLPLVGFHEALDPLDGTGGGPRNGSIAAGGTGETAAIFRYQAVAVVMTASVIGTSLGEANFTAVTLSGPVSGKD